MSNDPEYLVAVHEFKGRSDDEISLQKGDQILVLENDKGFGDGWYIGRNLSSNKAGLFPRVFTTNLILPTPAPLTGSASSPSATLSPSKKTEPSPSNSNSYSNNLPYNYSHNGSVTDTLTDIDEAISEINNGSRSDLADSTPLHTTIPTQQVHQNLHANQVEQTPEIYSYSNVQSWTPAMVQQYFLSRGYDPLVCQCFANHNITGTILLELDLAYLKEIDITSFGTRFEISKEIKQLNQLARNSTSSQNTAITSQPFNNYPPPTPVSNTSSIIRNSVGSGAPTSPNLLMSPPQFKRQSVLRTAKDNTTLNSYLAGAPMSPPYQPFPNSTESRNSNSHKKDPSFDPNWVHPATIKQRQEQDRKLRANSTRVPKGNSNDNLDNLQTPKGKKGGRVRSSTISTTDQYFYDNQESPDRPAMPSPLAFQLAAPKNQSFVEATQRQLQTHSRQGSKDTIRGTDSPYTASKHAHSTSSLGLSEFRFLNKIDASTDDLTTEQDRSSSYPNIHNPLPVPEKDTHLSQEPPSYSEKELPNPLDFPQSKKEFIQSEGEPKEGKRVGTDPTFARSTTPDSSDGRPKRSSTSAGQKKKNKPTLRSSSSHSNLKSKQAFSSSKQKTSAFQAGINFITPADASKTASYSGWMNKRGTVAVGTWKARFFCLHGTRLSYFTSFNDTSEKGLIDLTSHRVMAVGDSDDKFVALYAASVGAGRYCFKVVPPVSGTRKGLTFTVPKVHYFAVDTREEMRGWMAAIVKATIDRDDTVPVISSCVTPTVPLVKAQELFAEARAKEELNRAKVMAAADTTMFGGQINASWLNGFGQYGDDGLPSTPDSPPTTSSVKSAETGSTNNTGSSLAKGVSKLSSPEDSFNQQQPNVSGTGANSSSQDGGRHMTTKTAGLRVNTEMNNGTAP